MVGKGDFIELEFTGRTIDGNIFDTNVKSDADSVGIEKIQENFVLCIGKRMVIDGLDSFLEGKEIEKEYSVNLPPENAFGPRKKDLIKLMPAKSFIEKKINPKPGMVLALDNYLVRIVAVSGGRVLVDFNNPLAGKEVSYTIKIKRKVDDINEKVKSIIKFFFKQDIEFEIKEKRLILKMPEFMKQVVDNLNKEFGNVLDLEIILEPIYFEKKD